MKNYRVTRRGKIVFSGLIILIVIASIFIASYFRSNFELSSNHNVDNSILDEESGIQSSNDLVDKSDENLDENKGDKIEIVIENVSDDENKELNEAKENETVIDENKEDANFKEMYTLYYDPDDYNIDTKNALILDEYYDIAIKNKSDIIIEGNYHLGKDCDLKMFEYLSYQRAFNVQNYLIDKGMDEKRFIIIDKKHLNPKNIDSSDFEISLNRRVDLYFKEFYEQSD